MTDAGDVERLVAAAVDRQDGSTAQSGEKTFDRLPAVNLEGSSWRCAESGGVAGRRPGS
jgi:hypothetical protein